MFESNLNKGKPNGYAPLNNLGLIPLDNVKTVTGGTYSDGTLILLYTDNTTISINGFSSGNTVIDTFVSGGTYSDGTATFTNTTGGTFNVTGFITGGSGTALYWYAENVATPAVAPVATGNGSIALGDGAQALGSNMFVYGASAGFQATNAQYSNFLGQNAGYLATGASQSNFLGFLAGYGATDADVSNFLGNEAGYLATGASNSNFFGDGAGYLATNANLSNFIGNSAGYGATQASNSNLFGYAVGKTFTSNNLGSNNIIIGTNISLPNATANAINLGGILFGTGAYSTTSGNPSIEPVATGRIGLGIVTPTNTLHVSADLDPVRFEGLSSNITDNDIVSVDATGVMHRYPISGLSTNTVAINTQTAGYVLQLTDQSKLIEMSAATSINVTVPPYTDVNYPTGIQILLVRGGVGDVSVIAGLGVTIKSANSYLTLNNQYSPATLLKVDTNTWYLFGDLKA